MTASLRVRISLSLAFVVAASFMTSSVIGQDGVVKPMTLPELMYNDALNNAKDLAAAQNNAVRAKAKFTGEIQSARRAFFTAFKKEMNSSSKEEMNKTRGPYHAQLHRKDMYFLWWSLVAELDPKRMEAVDALTGGAVDGGIQHVARPRFDDWVNAVRKNLDLQPGMLGLMALKEENLKKALAASAEEYSAYWNVRNRVEMAQHGIGKMPDPDYRDPAVQRRKYQAALEAQHEAAARSIAVSQQSTEYFTRRFSGVAEAEKVRQGLMAGFTPKAFEAAWEKVHAAPKDAAGRLTDPKALGVPADKTDPYDALTALLMAGHPSRQVMIWLVEDDPRHSIPAAGEAWAQLKTHVRHHARVLTRKATEIEHAPRRSDDPSRIADPRRLGGWSDRPGRLLKQALIFGDADLFLVTVSRHRDATGRTTFAALNAGARMAQFRTAAEKVRLSLLSESTPYDDLPADIIERIRAAMPADNQPPAPTARTPRRESDPAGPSRTSPAFCTHCGTRLAPPGKFCTACGRKVQ